MDSFDNVVDLDEALRRDRISRSYGSASDEHDPWLSPDVSLLGNGRRSAPLFPLSYLGSHWAEWTETRAKGASAPHDYVATALLASTGALLANVRWACAGASWTEPPIIWAALVGSPSAGKSPAMDAAFGLIKTIEDRMGAGFEDEQRLYEMKREAAEALRASWKEQVKAAVKDGAASPIPPEGARIPDPPVQPRVRVADATVEKLGALAAGLPRGLLMVRDELAGWLGAFDKYGGGGSDRAFAIEMYGGRSYVVDRMKSPEPLRIRHLSIGVLGGVQPDKLPGITDGPDDGLASRFLWSWPDNLPEFRLARDVSDDSAARIAFERLSSLTMGSDAYGNPEPIILRLTAHAEDVLEEFARDMVRRSNDASGPLAGSIGKARGQALRLATVLEFLWWSAEPDRPEPASIAAPAVTASCGLLDIYFLPMAERVYGDAAIPKRERTAMALIRHLRKTGATEFNARTLRREIGGNLRNAAVMDITCTTLVEAGLIRPKFSRAGAHAGRRAQNYEIHPVVFGGPHEQVE